MSSGPLPPNSPSELKARIEAERRGTPFVIYRNGDDEQVITALDPATGRIAIGRGAEVNLDLGFDPEVSRLHAVFEPIGGDWIVSDEGFSRNGTFVNGERVVGRRRLRDGDLLHIGATFALFRNPADDGGGETLVASAGEAQTQLPEAQQRVLVALCRPFFEAADGQFASPATNREIADELFISTETVKSHLRLLFERFDLAAEAQNVKRARLAEAAMRSGTVSPRDYTGRS